MKRLGLILLIIGLSLNTACSLHNNEKQPIPEPDPIATSPIKKDLTKAAYYNMQIGIDYLRRNKVVRAKEKLVLAFKQDPHSPKVLDAMAYFYEKTGDLEEARKYYRRALRIAPNDGSVLNNYGAFMCRQHNFKEAEKYFLAAVQVHEYINTSQAYENAGLCAMAVPKYQLAKSYFKKALLNNPSSTTATFELASLSFIEKKYKDAEYYLDDYAKIALPGAKALWLGVQISHKLGAKDKEAQYTISLKARFPKSEEYRKAKALVERT